MHAPAVKPNHELQYTIGTDFCLEDLTSNFHLMVTCLLTRDPQPPPQFQWILALNNTMLHLSSEDTITYHYHGLSVYQENNTFTLNGTLIVGLVDSSTLDITCNVSNIHGSDRDSTSISLCGKNYPFYAIKTHDAHDVYVYRSHSVPRWCDQQLHSGMLQK